MASGRVTRARMGVVIAAAVVLAAVVFVPSAAAQSILDPASPSAHSLKRLYDIMFALGILVFLLVEGLILFAAFRFRRREGDGEPKQVHGSTGAEIAWTVAPAIVVLGLAAASYGPLMERRSAPLDSLVIDVTGKQWFWEFAYPDADVITADELVLPVGQTVTLRLHSADVIHSFWVPQLSGKMDAIPGPRQGGAGQNELWFTPEREGEYWGQCAELCGTQHAGMRFMVRVVSVEDFEGWLAEQALPAREPRPGSLEAEGRKLVGQMACKGCHVIDGVDGMVGRVGPNLTHVSSRPFLAGAVFENTEENIARWVTRPDDLKPGSRMPSLGLTPEQVEAVTAYLRSLD